VASNQLSVIATDIGGTFTDIVVVEESGRVRRVPAALLKCGPAAGVIGAAKHGMLSGYSCLLTFDMGGTTAKAELVRGGDVNFTDVFEVGAKLSSGSVLSRGGGYALKETAIDMAEVGAGGGSICSLDGAGAIPVSPQSAESNPGPACYGLGSDRPTSDRCERCSSGGTRRSHCTRHRRVTT
jgi:N-methylhydantoinase A